VSVKKARTRAVKTLDIIVPGPGGLIFTSKNRAMDLGLPTPSMIFRPFKKKTVNQESGKNNFFSTMQNTSQLVNYDFSRFRDKMLKTIVKSFKFCCTFFACIRVLRQSFWIFGISSTGNTDQVGGFIYAR
jgi:hypothetical protein